MVRPRGNDPRSPIFQNGAFYRFKNLKLWVMPNELSFKRAGFLVSKKNAVNLVGVKRIKRLLKEAYRLNKCTLKNGFDLVIAGQGILEPKLKLRDIEGNLLLLFKKACLTADRQDTDVK